MEAEEQEEDDVIELDPLSIGRGYSDISASQQPHYDTGLAPSGMLQDEQGREEAAWERSGPGSLPQPQVPQFSREDQVWEEHSREAAGMDRQRDLDAQYSAHLSGELITGSREGNWEGGSRRRGRGQPGQEYVSGETGQRTGRA